MLTDLYSVVLETPNRGSSIDFAALTELEPRIQIQDAFLNGESIGEGLFVSTPEGVQRDTFLARYPGEPHWYTGDEHGDIYPWDKYTLQVGTFRVTDETGRKIVERVLAWNPVVESEIDESNIVYMSAHKVNSSHPKSLDPYYRKPNSYWGFRIISMPLDSRIQPRIELYLIACCSIAYGQQILCDYHWVFAYENGNWCLDRDCAHCVQGLKVFVSNLI